MSHSSGRILFITLLGLVFLYLSLNVALNLTPLRTNLSNRLQETVSGRVEVGYLFLNWRMRPVIRSISITDPGTTTEPRGEIFLEELTMNINWAFLLRGQFAESGRFIRNMAVEHAKFFNVLSFEIEDKSGGTDTIFPRVPINVKEWTFTVTRDNGRILSSKGESLRVAPEKRTISSRLTEYQENEARGRLILKKRSTGWEGRATFDDVSLSDDLWGLENDRWSGQVIYRNPSRENRIKIKLNGTPGKIAGKRLPQTKIRSELSTDSVTVDVKILTVKSDYFQSTFWGRVNLQKNLYGLKGNFSLELGDGVSEFFGDEVRSVLTVTQSDTVSGTITVNGSVSQPKVSGTASLPETTVEVSLRGDTFIASVEDVKARFDRNRITINQGTIREKKNHLFLRDGAVELAENQLKLTLNGRIEISEFHTIGKLFLPQYSSFVRNIRRISLPARLSMDFGPENYKISLDGKEGRFKVGPVNFTELNLKVAYFSSGDTAGRVRGKMKGPDDNSWSINGKVNGPLEVEGRLKKLKRWVRFPFSQLNNLPELRLKGVRARVKIPSLTTSNSPQLQLTSGQSNSSQLSIGDNSFPLECAVVSNFDTMEISMIRLGSKKNRLNLSGSLDLKTPVTSSPLNLTVGLEQFPVEYFLPSPRPNLSGRMAGDLRISGTFGQPQMENIITFSKLKYRRFVFKDLRLGVQGNTEQANFTVRKGSLNGNSIRGNLTVNSDGRIVTDLSMSEVSFRSLFPEISWLDHTVSGRLNLHLNILTEKTGGKSRLEGTLEFPELEYRDLVFRDLGLQVRGSTRRVQFDLREGTLNGNSVRGNIRMDSKDRILTDLTLSQASFRNMFPEDSWFANNASGRFNLNLTLRRAVTSGDPRFEGTVELQELQYRHLMFKNLGLDMEGSTEQTKFTVREGTLNGNSVQGSFRIHSDGRIETDLILNKASLQRLFPEDSWMANNASGQFNLNLDVGGYYWERSSWNGKITGKFDELIFSHFPRIQGMGRIADASIFEQPLVIRPHEFTLPVRNGKTQVNNVTLRSPGMKLGIDGTIRPTGELKLDLSLTLMGETLKMFLEDLLANLYRKVGLLQERKKLTIPFVVQGEIESPKLIVKRSELSRNYRRNLINKLLTKPIGYPINELLDEIFSLGF